MAFSRPPLTFKQKQKEEKGEGRENVTTRTFLLLQKVLCHSAFFAGAAAAEDDAPPAAAVLALGIFETYGSTNFL